MGALRQAGSRIAVFGHMIRFSHSVFALPFALAGVLFAGHAHGGYPSARVWLLVVVAMVGARTAAMGFNRILDRGIDAANPRTRDRELPAGRIGLGAAWGLTALSAALFIAATAGINPLALALSPLALAIVFFYSFTKRFTWASHLFLGLALAVAPVGGWVAVAGSLDLHPFLPALGVLAWVAGFDVFYALQDREFDLKSGLYSLPAHFGERGAFVAARLLHTVAVVALLATGVVLHLSPAYYVGMGIIAALLVYEHRLIRPGDLRRLDKAFFDMNAVISVLYLVSAAAGVWW